MEGYELVCEHLESKNIFYELRSNCINFIIEKIERQRSEGLTFPDKIEDYFKIVNPKVEENIKQLYENDIKSQGYILHNLPNTKSADNQNNTQGINSHVLDFANKLTTEQLAYYRKEQNSEMPLDESRKMYNNYIEYIF